MNTLRFPLSLAFLALAVVGCGDPGEPQSSSSSNWLRCSSDAQCDNLSVAATCGADGFCASSGGAKIEQTLVFQDEFEDASLNPANFKPETGYSLRNGDAEAYTSRPENVKLEGGELVLSARSETFGSAKFTSGSVETNGLQSFTYGRFEASILAPTGAGTGPTFWLLPQDPGSDKTVCNTADDCTTGSWPAWGDIVVMTVRSEQPTHVLHTASYAKEDATLGLTRGQGGATTELAAPVSDGYHDYAIEWGPKRIDWFIDGNLEASLDTTLPEIVRPDGVAPFQQAFYVKLLLAVGGLSEAPIAADYPQEMRVRSFKVWQYR